MTRPCRISIDLSAVIHNVKVARACAPASRIVAVVKANAYGHGAVDVARALRDEADVFAVSCLEEAQTLREAGIDNPLLMLEGCFGPNELARCVALDVELVCHQHEQIRMLENLDAPQARTIWLKVDTGMHRLGIRPEDAAQATQKLLALPGVCDVVLTTHLANADVISSDYTDYQLKQFEVAQKAVERAIGRKIATSVPNSAGLMAWPDSHCAFHRPGIMLYGLSPFENTHPVAEQLRAVMTFEADVIALRQVKKDELIGYGNHWQAQRDSLIATVSAGYGDGYPRGAKNGTPAWLNGHRVPLAGRVSMDMIMLDATELPRVEVGDTVELWGKHVSANEVAMHAGTIGYELVTRMTGRASRSTSYQ